MNPLHWIILFVACIVLLVVIFYLPNVPGQRLGRAVLLAALGLVAGLALINTKLDQTPPRIACGRHSRKRLENHE